MRKALLLLTLFPGLAFGAGITRRTVSGSSSGGAADGTGGWTAGSTQTVTSLAVGISTDNFINAGAAGGNVGMVVATNTWFSQRVGIGPTDEAGFTTANLRIKHSLTYGLRVMSTGAKALTISNPSGTDPIQMSGTGDVDTQAAMASSTHSWTLQNTDSTGGSSFGHYRYNATTSRYMFGQDPVTNVGYIFTDGAWTSGWRLYMTDWYNPALSVTHQKYVGVNTLTPLGQFEVKSGTTGINYVLRVSSQNGTAMAGVTADGRFSLGSGSTWTFMSGYGNAGQVVVGDGNGGLTMGTVTSTITSSGGGSSLAVTTGATTGWTGAVSSSPTAVLNLSSNSFTVSPRGGATNYIDIRQDLTLSTLTISYVGGGTSGTMNIVSSSSRMDLGVNGDTATIKIYVDTVTINDQAVVTVSEVQTLTNKTFDAAATGNVLKQSTKDLWTNADYITTSTNAFSNVASTYPFYNQAKFDPSVATTTNKVYLRWFSGPDYNSGVLPTCVFSDMKDAVDTSTRGYIVSIASVSAGDVLSTLTFGNIVRIKVPNTATGGQGASGISATTNLTGWDTFISASNQYIIQIAREGDSTVMDPSTVGSYFNEFYLMYGTTQ
jgi:hypothetical protein